VEWARTLRIDAAPSDALEQRLRRSFAHEGIKLSLRGSQAPSRTYALVEGPPGLDPAEIDWSTCGARAFDEPVIALAIEPAPTDALPFLQSALSGEGAPAGVLGCEIAGKRIVVEFAPSVTPAPLVMRLIDVELARFAGNRKVELLSPLSLETYTQIAAQGLSCEEIVPQRVLEALIGGAHVG